MTTHQTNDLPFCPACGHAWTRHDQDDNRVPFCRRALNELPSCGECRAPLERIQGQSTSVRGFGESGASAFYVPDPNLTGGQWAATSTPNWIQDSPRHYSGPAEFNGIRINDLRADVTYRLDVPPDGPWLLKSDGETIPYAENAETGEVIKARVVLPDDDDWDDR